MQVINFKILPLRELYMHIFNWRGEQGLFFFFFFLRGSVSLLCNSTSIKHPAALGNGVALGLPHTKSKVFPFGPTLHNG